jgi:hypothetical protein
MPAKTQTPLVQPPFAAQLNPAKDRALGLTPHLQHGYMIWDQQGGNGGLGYAGGRYNGRSVFNFQYNPQTVSASFATESTSAQASMLYNAPGASDILAIPLAQSVNWTLYFDRTFEVNYDKPNNTVNDPAVIGVQADVISIMQFTGMLSNLAAGLNNIKTPVVNKGGVMMNIFSWVYFGNNVPPVGNGHYSRTIFENRIGYYGFVSGWNVDYTAWTQNMVPYRATISLTFQLLPSTSSSYLSNGALAQGVLDPYGNLAKYTSPKKAKKP